jgi:hypothetical protein
LFGVEFERDQFAVTFGGVDVGEPCPPLHAPGRVDENITKRQRAVLVCGEIAATQQFGRQFTGGECRFLFMHAGHLFSRVYEAEIFELIRRVLLCVDLAGALVFNIRNLVERFSAAGIFRDGNREFGGEACDQRLVEIRWERFLLGPEDISQNNFVCVCVQSALCDAVIKSAPARTVSG